LLAVKKVVVVDHKASKEADNSG